MNDTKKELIEIMEKYNIGKKPLSKLLGWGETTVINQLKEDSVVTKEFADRIHSLWENPFLYLDILEDNKENLTDVAYRKSRAAVMRCLEKDRAALLFVYIARLANYDVAPYHLIATIFYAQSTFITYYNKSLFGSETVFSKQSEIPYPEIYNKLLKDGVPKISGGGVSIPEEESRIIKLIYNTLCEFSPIEVKKLLKLAKEELMERCEMNATTWKDDEYMIISHDKMHNYGLDVLNSSKVFVETRSMKLYFKAKLAEAEGK